MRALNRGFGLGKTNRNLPGLVGYRQRVERTAFRKPLDAREESGRNAHLAFETACKNLPCDRSLQGSATGRDPQPPARQSAFKVRYWFAVGRDDETDHVGHGLYLARDRAAPLRAGRATPRPGIKFVIVNACEHA